MNERVPGRANIFGARVSLTRQGNDGDAPPPPFIMDGRHPEWLPRRAALPISSVDSVERSVAARRSWAAPGLSGGRFVVAAASITLHLGRIWKYPINQQEECFGGSIVLHMHRI